MNEWKAWAPAFQDLIIFAAMFLIGPGRYSVDGEPLTARDAAGFPVTPSA